MPSPRTLASQALSSKSDHRGEEGASDEPVPPDGEGMLPMVGLGGSAGSIGPLQEFFAAMPANAGLVFVVILHLSPEHESALAETIQRRTALPVKTAVDGVKVEANVVYVIPPGKHLRASDGHLHLVPVEGSRGRHTAVDVFFRTLADSHGCQSVGVVLSGADGDGALGIKRIKELGGLTIAQDPDEAEHSGMPRSAIATGMVDWVLKIREMPERLISYTKIRSAIKLPDENGPHPAQAAPSFPDEQEGVLREVLAFLRTRTARDFTYYKRATILRRIARRMQVNGLCDLPSYLEYLRTHTGEAGALLQDLLISVTNFFRDPENFEALAGIVPELFKGKGASDTVRVWVPACATGEEAYSIAMLLCEHARTLEAPPQLQIFATDLDEEAIRTAREGVYPETITADVSEDRLHRFFLKEHRGYRVRREVREVVLFAPHDLLKDSPFSRVDLISCRNLLIYINRDAQKRAFEIFHFGLRSGGRLFLGSSETVDERSDLFVATDKRHRLYLQRPGPRQLLQIPSGQSTLARSLELQERERDRPTVPGRVTVESVQSGTGKEPALAGGISWSDLHYHLIERVSPPSVLVNSSHEIMHLSESAGRFFQFSGGEPTRNILKAVHPMLRMELRAALFAAAQNHAASTAFRIPCESGETRNFVDLRVEPVDDLAPGLLLVIFEEHQEAAGESAVAAESVQSDHVSQHLERELEITKARLRDTIEESEASSQELKANNEELQAMNEELQSATEELETSREELQSINEELTTVNQELKSKVDELALSNSDLHNLMSATAIATVFLDRELRILRYTPSAVSLFNFIPTDVGRPLTDLARRLDYPDIVSDAKRTLEQLADSQREVRSGSHWLLARALPYRTPENHILGVVFTFLDITARKNAEDALRESEEKFRTIVSQAAAGVGHADLTGRLTLVNPRLCNLIGRDEDEMIGQQVASFAHPNDRPELEKLVAILASEGTGFESEQRWIRKDGSMIWVNSAWAAVRNAEGVPQASVMIVVELTERKLAETALIEAREAAEAANASKDRFLAVLSHELRTPLTPVLMAVASLEHDPSLRPDVREDLTMMKRNIELETKLIDDLLDLNRITTGKLELHLEPIDLHEAVRHVCGMCGSQLQTRRLDLEMILDETSAPIVADPARLQQVLWNLLKNAIKFTSDEGTIRISTKRLANGHWEVRVQDSGIGISAEVLPRIFDAFEQGGTNVTQQFGGLGLGLAICKALVELHRGTIRAESEGAGKGSTFILELPGEVSTNLSQAPIAPVASRGKRHLRLLVVEDHPDTSRVLARLLRAGGFTAITASTVGAAIAAVERESFDVLISDLGLPDGKGYEIMRRVREIHSIPGIAMSGYGMDEDVRLSREAGFAEHLVKPVEGAQLIAAIGRVTQDRP